ncbi:hypothetical protein ACFTZB_26900 [Rhodococcus sp. NPDC057014]|uniref:hypothetical protein n=1 Tax=Rhodococcus sp. NPDC057014 TaxID=3346000 RepID=UPI00362A214F
MQPPTCSGLARLLHGLTRAAVLHGGGSFATVGAVLPHAVELPDYTASSPEEIDTAEELAGAVVEHMLEFGRRQVVLVEADAAQRFSRALTATVEKARCPPRLCNAFTRSGPADLGQNFMERDESTVQGRIAGDDSLVEG